MYSNQAHLAFIYAPSNELVFFNPLIIRCVSGATLCPSCAAPPASQVRTCTYGLGNTCKYIGILKEKQTYISSYRTPLLHDTSFHLSVLNEMQSICIYIERELFCMLLNIYIYRYGGCMRLQCYCPTPASHSRIHHVNSSTPFSPWHCSTCSFSVSSGHTAIKH